MHPFTRKRKNVQHPEIEDAHRPGSGPGPDRAAYGLKVLYNCSTAEVDIVAVHGLNGHRESTFTAANGTCWLRSLLPAQVPNIRVLSYGYDARTHSSSLLSQEHLHDHAEQLIEELRRERTITKTTRRPIIFIGHCLGGLIIKTALILSANYSESHLPDRRYIKVSTYGILFMGTPHQGGEGVTWGILARNLASIFVNTNKEILEHLARNSEWLEYQQTLFLSICNQFDTICFYETYPTSLSGGSALVVLPKHSACIPGAVGVARIAIFSDHINMVRFENADDDGFRKVYGELSIMLPKALQKVKENWGELTSVKHSAVDQPSQASSSITMHLPFPKNNNFTGRDRELAEIHRALHSTNATTSHQRVIVLHGLGGIGKTQLAVQYAYIHQHDYTSVWWVNASTTQSLSQGFLQIAKKLLAHQARNATPGQNLEHDLVLPQGVVDQNGELNESRDVTGTVVNAITSWFAAEGNNQWLLIIDNYDDLRNVNIYDFLHPSSSGSILITSRSRDTRRVGNGLEVQEVTEEEALEILRKSAHMDLASFQKEQSDAVAIVRKVGALPLALDQAGSYVSAMQIPFSKYLLRFEHSFAEVASKKPPEAVWQYRDDTVFTTWEISFNALGPAAQELLLLFGFLDNEGIPGEILSLERLANGFRIDSVDDAIREIFSLSLAKRKEMDAIWVHPLVHSWSHERLDQIERKRKALHAISLVAAAVSIDHSTHRKVEDWVKERKLLPHIQRCVPRICRYWSAGDIDIGASHRDDIKTLAEKLSYYGEQTTPSKIYQCILAIEEKSLGKDHPNTICTVYFMANLFRRQGKYGEALRWYRRALAGDERNLGKDHPDTISTVFRIANMLQHQGKYEEALGWYKRALTGGEKHLSKDYPNFLSTIYAMASVFEDTGKYNEALEWYKRALVGQERYLGKDHPYSLTTVHGVANVLRNTGKSGEALEWYRRALAGREKWLGEHAPDTLYTVSSIAAVLRNQGKYDEALEWYRRALTGLEKSRGKDHPETLSALSSMAVVLQYQGRYHEALGWYRRALAWDEKNLGKDHPDTLSTVFRMASVFQDQGKYDEALEWYSRALAGQEKSLGSNHPSTLSTVHGMATAFRGRGNGRRGAGVLPTDKSQAREFTG